jgi:putative membrane protein insertion efficiency factor
MGKRAAIVIIKMYRYFIRPFLIGQCRFYPHCSLYAEIAIEQHGVVYGSWLILQRLLKCHPWYPRAGYDPVPKKIMIKKSCKRFYDR